MLEIVSIYRDRSMNILATKQDSTRGCLKALGQQYCYNGRLVEKLKLLDLCLISSSEADWEIEESENYSGELLIKVIMYQNDGITASFSVFLNEDLYGYHCGEEVLKEV